MTNVKLTQLEMSDADIEFAERIGRALGFNQLPYCSTSAIIGVQCLPDRDRQKSGAVIKTKEMGFLFVSTIEDLNLDDLAEEEFNNLRKKRKSLAHK